jgi:DNA-binding MarR family transcriptional regulator
LKAPSWKRQAEPEFHPELTETLEFMRLLWAIDHGLQQRSKRMATALGMSGPQRLVVRMVGRFPGISAGELADVLHLHPSSLTGTLRRLEQKRLLVRRRDPRDARRIVLELSATGRRRDVETHGTIETAMKGALAHLSRRQLEVVRQALLTVANELSLTAGVSRARPRGRGASRRAR